MPQPDEPAVGHVKAIAYRAKRRESMQQIDSCEVLTGIGLAMEDRPANNRQVTILDHNAWLVTCNKLDTNISWLLRRANFLVEGLVLQNTVGCMLTLGGIRLIIRGETKPCALMDYQRKGLREILKPDWRGGVFAEVLGGGIVSVGDKAMLCHDRT